jgi:hypothetical protein
MRSWPPVSKLNSSESLAGGQSRHPVVISALAQKASLKERFKNKREPLFSRHHWYPHNAITQGTVVAGEPLIEKSCSSVIFGSDAVLLNRKSVEYKYGSIPMVEAFCQDLIRVQPTDSEVSEAIWKGSVEKGDIIRS